MDRVLSRSELGPRPAGAFRFGGLLLALALLSPRPCHAANAPVREAAPESTKPRTLAPSRPVPTATYWLAGASVGCLATAAVLVVSARNSIASASASCSGCTFEKSDINRRVWTARVVGLTGGVLAAFAVYGYLSRPAVSQAARQRGLVKRMVKHVAIADVPSGAVAEVRWSF